MLYFQGLAASKEEKAVFREAFSRLGELRSLLRPKVPTLILTATAGQKVRKKVLKMVHLKKDQVKFVLRNPAHKNIKFAVAKVKGLNVAFQWLVQIIKEQRQFIE